MSDINNPVAGWYPDPQGSGQQRWWDGTQWTMQFQPAGAGTVSSDGKMNTPLVVLGYIFAIIPLVGLILGIVAWNRPERATRKHGPWIVLAAVVVFVVALAVQANKHS
jgi:uncharacterized membrane protein YidH (DUF202 family)